jgi:hypothetical protein
MSRPIAMMDARSGPMQREQNLQIYAWCACAILKNMPVIQDDLNFSTMIPEHIKMGYLVHTYIVGDTLFFLLVHSGECIRPVKFLRKMYQI